MLIQAIRIEKGYTTLIMTDEAGFRLGMFLIQDMQLRDSIVRIKREDLELKFIYRK